MFSQRIGLSFLAVSLPVVASMLLGCAPFRATSPNLKSNSNSLELYYSGTEDFQCAASSDPRPVNIRRLTSTQYTNVIVELLTLGRQAPVASTLASIFGGDGKLPFDSVSSELHFGRTDNDFLSDHAYAYYKIAAKFAAFITGDGIRLKAFIESYIEMNNGGCTSLNMAAPASNCINAFIANFGLRAFRRPLSSTGTDNELGLLRREYDTKSTAPAQGFANVLVRSLLAPQFLFTMEDQGEFKTSKMLRLTAYEMASRLSFHFWNSMPDQKLFEAARSGDLLRPDKYPALVEYVYSSARTRNTMEEFYRGWLKLDRIPTFSNATDKDFVYLAKGIQYNDALKQKMIADLLELTNFVTWEAKGSFIDLYTSDVSFARDPDLMKIYGVSTPAPAVVTKVNATRLPAGERAGILTRPAMLISGVSYQNPVKRGIHILDDILCATIVQPKVEDLPEGALEDPPLDPNKTTRMRYADKTSPRLCQGCHMQINAVGFGLESFNTLGFHRKSEAIFSESGDYVKDLPVDAHVNLTPVVGGGAALSSDPVKFSQLIAQSMDAQKCVSRVYYEFSYGRKSNDSDDGCALAKMRKSMGTGNNKIEKFFMSTALDEDFQVKNLKDEE